MCGNAEKFVLQMYDYLIWIAIEFREDHFSLHMLTLKLEEMIESMSRFLRGLSHHHLSIV